jgi:hypothetical protein
MLRTIFLIIAIVLFILQAAEVKLGKVGFGWIGLAFFAGAFLI